VLHVEREVPGPAAGGGAGGRRRVAQLVAYCFIGGDGVVATHAGRLARDAWQRVAQGRVDRWAYVLLQADAGAGEAAALARMQAVLAGVWPVLRAPPAEIRPGHGKNS
jgi:hypothetical protein